MKKVIGLFIAVMLFGMISQATAGVLKFEPPKGIGGDVVYDFRDQAVGIAGSVTLANFGKDNICEVRAVYASFEKEGVSPKVGGGVGVSIPKLLNSFGWQGIPEWFNTSVGVMVLVDVRDNIEAALAVYITAIKMEF